jgi:hypothetical protein
MGILYFFQFILIVVHFSPTATKVSPRWGFLGFFIPYFYQIIAPLGLFGYLHYFFLPKCHLYQTFWLSDSDLLPLRHYVKMSHIMGCFSEISTVFHYIRRFHARLHHFSDFVFFKHQFFGSQKHIVSNVLRN